MGYCTNCGSEVDNSKFFCPNCGAPVATGNNNERFFRASECNNANKIERAEVKEQREVYKENHARRNAPYSYDKPVSAFDKYGKFYGIALLLIAIMDFFSDPPIFTILLSIAIMGGAVVCLTKKYKLKGFTIAALILAIFCIICGFIQANKFGLFKTPKDEEYNEVIASEEEKDTDLIQINKDDSINTKVEVEAEAPDQECTVAGITFTIPGKYRLENDEYIVSSKNELIIIGDISEGCTDDVYKEKLDVIDEIMQNFVVEILEDSTIEEITDSNVAGFRSRVYHCSGIYDSHEVVGYFELINVTSEGRFAVIAAVADKEYAEEIKEDYTGVKNSARYNGSASASNESENQPKATGGVDPDLKAFLDSYESFMDEYVDFMKKYQADPTNAINMMSEYTDMLTEYSDFVKKADAYDQDKMSKEDLEYYIDTMARIEKKLLSVMQ